MGCAKEEVLGARQPERQDDLPPPHRGEGAGPGIREMLHWGQTAESTGIGGMTAPPPPPARAGSRDRTWAHRSFHPWSRCIAPDGRTRSTPAKRRRQAGGGEDRMESGGRGQWNRDTSTMHRRWGRPRRTGSRTLDTWESAIHTAMRPHRTPFPPRTL